MTSVNTPSEPGKGRRAPQAQKAAGNKTSRTTKAKVAVSTGTARTTKTKVAVPTATRSRFSDDEWYEMVATAAYYRAQARGFEGGTPELDWYEAEDELEEQLSRD